MVDFINKIITIILVFVMLVLAPQLISYKADEEILARREILNDVEVFIDKIQDTSSITEDDLNYLYLSCNSHGLTVDVKVKRLIAAAVYDAENDIAQTNYFATDDPESLANINNGDVIQVHVEEVTTSSGRQATYSILGIDEGKLEFTLAGVVG